MNLATKLSNKILHSAIRQGATDVHFYPAETDIKIYFRIYGKRKLYKSVPHNQYQLLKTYYKFSSGMDIGETRKPQNGVLNIHQQNKRFALRISTLPTQQEESLAIRILPQDDQLNLNELFLFPHQLSKIKQWLTNEAGLILLTGPTGCGKTTTLYALLNSVLKNQSYQMITLEDPIEKEIPSLLQVQVNEKAGVTYQTGLKAALRHDPDIIMVGEIRDQHTAEFAFEASLTGHLVLSTLHAKDAPGTIHRLMDMGISETDILQTLIGVASVQLLPLTMNGSTYRRAAILDLLELNSKTNISLKEKSQHISSFQHLRKKAYAYGFIDEITYKSYS
ncbi:MAG TPA: competence type IV pilus ATPase ComGA [Virgibacillus sp.]|nr:competence type IV pilus ATPase ComGA [Virgibacillus sp.]